MKNKLANIISSTFHPLLIPLYGITSLLSLRYFFFYSFFQKLYIIFIIGIFTCVLPLAFLVLLKMTGYVSDWRVNKREERYPVYIVSLISYLLCIYVLWRLRIPLWVLSLAICVFAAVLAIGVINLFWKISIHATAAGCLAGGTLHTAILLHFNPMWFFISVLFFGGVILAARLQLFAHSLPQVLSGYVIGVFFTAILPFFL